MSVAVDLDVDRWLEDNRPALTRYCHSRLRSAADAEDAVQETFVRAWRGFDGFQGRSSRRSWLYAIAHNVCQDVLRGRERWRRSLEAVTFAADDGESGSGSGSGSDPGETIVARDQLRQAFVATLLHLPPRQRAALILCEGLRWTAAEVAELLSTTVASVTSALQRARATLAAVEDVESGPASRQVDGRPYVEAFARDDLDALVALLHPSDYATGRSRGR